MSKSWLSYCVLAVVACGCGVAARSDRDADDGGSGGSPTNGEAEESQTSWTADGSTTGSMQGSDTGSSNLAPSTAALSDRVTPAVATHVVSPVSPTIDVAATTDDAAVEPTPTSLGDGVEFIPWPAFQKSEIGDTGGFASLSAPLRVSSVASGGGEEDVLVAIESEGGDNVVLALDTRARTFRSHWLHVACGNCVVAASPLGSVILTESALYGSTDGGYPYFSIAEGGFGEPTEHVVRLAEDRVWVRSETGWLGALFAPNELFDAPSWSHLGIASVDRSSGLELTARYITRHSASGTTTTTDACATIPSVEYGAAFHSDNVVVVPCDERTVRVTRDFPQQPWQTVSLDAPLVWVGGAFVASAVSWYSVAQATLGTRVGSQSILVEGELVFGYVENEARAYRITSHGVAITPGFSPAPDAP